MTDDERLRKLLRSAFPVTDEILSRDLWPRAVTRGEPIEHVSWVDLVLAAAAFAALAFVPGWLSLLAYHL